VSTNQSQSESWYRQGRCPYCGRGRGGPKGLQHRKKFDDIYCHKCRTSFPLEMSLQMFREMTFPSPGKTLREEELPRAVPKKVLPFPVSFFVWLGRQIHWVLRS